MNQRQASAPLSPALARGVAPPTQAFIDGKYVDAVRGTTLDCIFPGDGKLIGHVAACDTEDVDIAVRSARAAFEAGAWSRAAPQDRRKVLSGCRNSSWPIATNWRHWRR